MRIGVSVVTLLASPHLVMFPGWPHRLAQFVLRTKLKVQLVPFWWWKEKELLHVPLELVVSLEGPWNPEDDLKALYQRVTNKDPAALLGPVFFGGPPPSSEQTKKLVRCFPGAWHIDTENQGWPARSLVEFGPNHPEVREGASPIVFDTWHAREVMPSEDAALELLHDRSFRSRIRLVQFQTRDRQEFEDFLAGKQNYLYTVLDSLGAYHWEGDIIIELSPLWLAGKTEETLQKTATAIRKVIATSRDYFSASIPTANP